MKLIEIKELKGKIILKSGLHIGSGDSDMSIGGMDNPVVRHSFTQEPYIPGSSLKGKIRSLLEMKYGLMAKTNGAPVKIEDVIKFTDDNQKNDCKKILKLFGSGATTDEALKDLLMEIGPSRLSFSDCKLNSEFREKAMEEHRPLFEVKSENTINRIKGTAEHPRFIERVPEGTEFDYSITIKIFDGDDNQKLEAMLEEGINLLQLDALGGSGSRGYGRVQFE